MNKRELCNPISYFVTLASVSVYDADDVLPLYQQNSSIFIKNYTSSLTFALSVAYNLFTLNFVSHLQDDYHAFWKLTHSLLLTPKPTHTLLQHWCVNPVKGSDWLLASDRVTVACTSDQNEDRGQKLTLTVRVSPVRPVSRPLYAQCQLTAVLKAVIVWVCWKTCLCVDRVMGK